MRRTGLLWLLLTVLAVVGQTRTADAQNFADWRALRHAQVNSWHAGYAHQAYGGPVALVVPPTAHMQARWGWGVSQNTMTPIYHQFRRPYPGPVMSTYPFRAKPDWPSHTDQFGVYYSRGPW